MSRHAEPVRTAAPRPADRVRPAPATETPVRCPGPAAQLAAVHRTLAGRIPMQLQATATKPPGQTSSRAGLPDRLRSGVEALSGLAMDDVRVHRDSAEPARLGALAYTQGSDIHLGPGQEQHLPHEVWHVVQQKQGRVKATTQMKGMAVSQDRRLEAEADRMGGRIETGAATLQDPSPWVTADAPLQRSDASGSGLVVQRQAGGAPAARPASRTGTVWSSADFVAHYYFGKGAAVDLADIGLAATFRNHPSVQKQVNDFIQLVLAKPKSETYVRDETVTDVTDTIFSVGHSTFFRTAYCGPAACGFTFSIRDWFRDPISKGIELGGTPYRIDHQWTESRLRPAGK